MRVVYQDCGCVALPGEFVSEMDLVSGSVTEIDDDAGPKVAVMAVVDPVDAIAEKTTAVSWRIRTLGA